jgi:hypothetical protein
MAKVLKYTIYQLVGSENKNYPSLPLCPLCPLCPLWLILLITFFIANSTDELNNQNKTNKKCSPLPPNPYIGRTGKMPILLSTPYSLLLSLALLRFHNYLESASIIVLNNLVSTRV